jgi:hypothetical protein
MTGPSPLPLATKSFLNVRRTTGHDVARRSCLFGRVRLDVGTLIGADTRVMCASAKQFRAVFRMTFRLQPRQTASVVVIVATQSP